MLASLRLCLPVKDKGTSVKRGWGRAEEAAEAPGLISFRLHRAQAANSGWAGRHPTMHFTLAAAASRLQGGEAPEQLEILLCFKANQWRRALKTLLRLQPSHWEELPVSCVLALWPLPRMPPWPLCASAVSPSHISPMRRPEPQGQR